MKEPKRTTLEELIENRASRRDVIKGVLAAGGAMTAAWCVAKSPIIAEGIEAFATDGSNPDTSSFPVLPHVHESDGAAVVSGVGVADEFVECRLNIRVGPVNLGALPRYGKLKNH